MTTLTTFSFLDNLFLVSMLLSGTLYITDKYRFMQQPLLLASVVYFACALIRCRKLIRPGAPFYALLGTILSMLISSLVAEDAMLFAQAVGFLGIGVVTMVIYPNLRPNDGLRRSLRWLLITHVPLIVLPLLRDGIPRLPYQGIFYNPNSFGTVLATLYGAFLAYFCGLLASNQERNVAHRVQLVLVYISMILSVVGVLLSNSRTSFLTCAVVTLAAIYVYMPGIKGSVMRRRDLKVIAVATIVGAISFVIGLIIEVRTRLLAQTIIEKFIRKAARGDVLAYRDHVWSLTISQARLFGGGRSFFYDVGVGAHSSYISLLGQYGWVTMILFIVFVVLCIVLALRYAKAHRYTDKYASLPLIFLLSFVTMSVTEGMFLKVSMFLAFLGAGFASLQAVLDRSRNNQSVRRGIPVSLTPVARDEGTVPFWRQL